MQNKQVNDSPGNPGLLHSGVAIFSMGAVGLC